MPVVLKKDKTFEFVYLKNVPVFYATVYEPRKKQKGDDREYSLTAFVTKEDRDKMKNEIFMNKGFAEVDVDTKQKGKNRGQLKYSSEDYPGMEGRFGVQFTLQEFSKKGKKQTLTVAGPDGKAFEESIGNGSICTIKLWGWRSQDDELNVNLDIVKVLEHVPYEGGSGGKIVDGEIGVDIEVEPKVTDDEMDDDSDDFGHDDDVPFDGADDDDSEY